MRFPNVGIETGITRAEKALVVPMATGMTMALFLMYIRSVRPNATYVIWPRIDQKTCLKCIKTAGSYLQEELCLVRKFLIFSRFAGYIPIIIENKLEGDELRTDIDGIKKAIVEHGASTIACIISTTSCFAPRGYDRVPEIAQIAQEHNIMHLVNNAYGLQASKCTHAVNEAIRFVRKNKIFAYLVLRPYWWHNTI
jgi:O-phospho-L-seryl-tRNASec:L-selenocysteinyl-tRNA synthase